ncbi:MAG TPA: polysaccharide biosynthesis tyrosine autokinase [bacterium]|nr:polysaccharide biosynthesis tyrosine autokinase [bacterium]HPS29197.1 polysaccharide biosynthesis tyrosine autokinase [bacterium]
MHEKEFDIKDILALMKRHIYLFISVIIVVMTLTVAYIYRSINIYKSTASIEIEPKGANILDAGMEVVSTGSQGYYWSNKEYYATQYEIIQSRAVAEKALESISGENILEYLGVDISKVDPEKVKDIDPIKIIQSKITVTPKKSSNIVEISVDDPDAEKAAFLANSVANAYIDFNLEKKYFATKDAAAWLLDQSLNLKKGLEDSEKMLFEFKQNNNVLATTFEAKQILLSTKIEKFTDTLTDQEIKRNALSARIEEYSKIDLDAPDESFMKEVSKDNQLINGLKLKYLETLSSLDETGKFYGEKHPKVLGLSAEKDNLKESLKNEVSNVVKSFDLELKTLEKEMEKNRKMLSDVQTEAILLNRLDIDYSKLKREVETNKKLFDIVLQRTKEADLSSLLKNNNVRIIDKAIVTNIPVSPMKKMIIMIGFFLSVLFGFVSILLYEFFDTRFRNFQEFEVVTKKPLLGIIPRFVTSETAEFKEIAFEHGKQSFAIEAFRSVRTNIRLSTPDIKLGTLLITSSITQEGKTTVSSNIGVSYSLAGKKVLLVDADMRKPRVHKLFGIKNETGLSTLVVGDNTIDQVIRKNVYEGLDVITCGPIPPNPAEILESERFHSIVKEFSSRYDLVIFDSPPLSPVSDGATIASVVDGVIVVVNINKTPRDVFKLAISKILKPGINFLGTIINDFDQKHDRKFKSYYNYSYYQSPYQAYYKKENNDDA